MRKLLILLSVVVLFAICQGQRPKPTSGIKRPFPLDCVFGYKKVNGTKKCRSKAEFFQHPRNETNCAKKNKTLKCYHFKNATACLCVKNRTRPHPGFEHKCPPGQFWRCKGYGRHQDCRCRKFVVHPVNRTELVKPNCDQEKEYVFCTRRRCICKKKKEIDPNEGVGLF